MIVFVIGCGSVTLVDGNVKKINTSCKSLKIKTIYIWGLASKNKNESNGSWFNRTTSVNKYFQVTDSNKIVSWLIIHFYL